MRLHFWRKYVLVMLLLVLLLFHFVTCSWKARRSRVNGGMLVALASSLLNDRPSYRRRLLKCAPSLETDFLLVCVRTYVCACVCVCNVFCWKVQRFSPEDLLALRRAPTRPLRSMPILGGDMSVIISEEPLQPVTAVPADQEEITKVRAGEGKNPRIS